MIVFLGDVLGRRKSIVMGCLFLTVGGILQATAFTLPHIIVGRVVGGLGVGVNTTTIPMWLSETARPSVRGKLVVIQLRVALRCWIGRDSWICVDIRQDVPGLRVRSDKLDELWFHVHGG